MPIGESADKDALDFGRVARPDAPTVN